MGELIWIDFDKLPTAALESLLRYDCYDLERAFLSDATILRICKILAKRRMEESPYSICDVEKKWEEFLRYYMDDET